MEDWSGLEEWERLGLKPEKAEEERAMKRRGDPDRRGMGAQSDFISESFVPNVQHVAEQKARIRVLPASGLSAEEVAGIFSVPVDRVLEASSRAEGASE